MNDIAAQIGLDNKPYHCSSVFDKMYMEVIPYGNDKGYTFMQCPCFCYANMCQLLKSKYLELSDDPIRFLFSEKRIEFLNKIIRLDYSYCKNCPKYKLKDSLGFWTETDFYYFWGDYGDKIKNSYLTGELKTVLPRTIGFNLDYSCNLACPTCRSKPIGHQYDITEEDQNALVYMAKQVEEISIGGNGEFFVSHNYDKLLTADYKGSKLKSIDLYTNGTLFNEHNWNKMSESARSLVKKIRISVDAACEETYKRVRGNHWDVLNKNLEFILSLKEKYNFELITTFTISTYNVSDAFDFYQWAINKGFDKVCFAFARDIFHPETGEPTESFIIPEDKRADIYDFLKTLRDKDGCERVVIE